MISYLKGSIAGKTDNAIIMDVGGIGFFVMMPTTDIAKIGNIGEIATVNTYFHIRDEQPELFGFITTDELSYFNKLIAISGVGPKAAMAILSVLSPSDLAFAVISEDVKAITRAQGVGTKVAQRVILELKSKIDTQDAIGSGNSESSAPISAIRPDTAAVNALIALGASPSEAQKTIMQMDTASLSTEEVIKEALRRYDKKISGR